MPGCRLDQFLSNLIFFYFVSFCPELFTNFLDTLRKSVVSFLHLRFAPTTALIKNSVAIVGGFSTFSGENSQPRLQKKSVLTTEVSLLNGVLMHNLPRYCSHRVTQKLLQAHLKLLQNYRKLAQLESIKNKCLISLFTSVRVQKH